jgi:PAS domain S-box-containing protein
MLGNIVVDRAIRRYLAVQFGFNLDIRSEYFETSPSPKEDFPVLLSWLHRKYSGQTFDVVVPVGAGALQFVQDYEKELFNGVPVVFFGRRVALDGWTPGIPITGVLAPPMEAQVRGTLAFIRALQPDLERLVVVTGTAAVDREWETWARDELKPFEGRIAVTYLSGLSLEIVLQRLASLPPKTAVLFLSVSEDGAGRRLLRTQILANAVQTATAPVYSTSALYLDTGMVGGALLDQEAMAVETAELIRRLLRGENIQEMPPEESRLVPMVNWNAMNRWHLRADRLPLDTIIKYKPPSILETHWWHIVGIISLCLLEAGLIVALLVHRANRKRAELAMVESQRLLQSTIDALNARVGLLDQDGTIIAVNRTWKSFAEANRYVGAVSGLGDNYLKAAASDAQYEEVRLVSNGIRQLISGEMEDFRCVYPSLQANGTSRWFQVRITRFDMQDTRRFVVTYEDVTEIKQAHDTQQQLTEMLLRAQDEERRRIARDLHDVTVQNMVAIKADLSGLTKRAKNLEPVAAEMLEESVTLSNQVIKELRTLSYLLHPPFLDELGLVPALRWFVRGFIQRSEVKVELMVMEEIGRLPAQVETALFRVVQECLTNIHRHSGSTSAVIWLTKERDSVVLRVRDEGHGFSLPNVPDDQAETLSPGVGILGMRQRLRQLGGRLEIESSPQGTCINASVSISEDQNDAYLVGR